ncbi:methyltransferase domain-containing protein [Actinomadura yumaensis]|uniref:methyltransferase domain-containing protein n=1 Tax=Actinomadura yumaensis TaxID=111807 RepID=UPI003620C634
MTAPAPEIAPDVAARWIARWDRQQQGYLPDREERFTALIDAVEAATGRPDPLVLDLGCGPGSLSGRLLDRLPGATVVAIDTDPLLLSLGKAVHAGRRGLRWADLDLRVPGWAARLRLDRQADAAVSTTALHWITGDELRVTYGELATVLRPGGLFLNGDNLTVEDTSPASPAWTASCNGARPTASSRAAVPRTGASGGTRSPRSRPSPGCARTARTRPPRTTARSRSCCRRTSARSARRASPRPAPSGNAATTASSPPCAPDSLPGGARPTCGTPRTAPRARPGAYRLVGQR